MDTPKVAKYIRIAQYIKGMIQDNTLKPGDLLPSDEELINEFQVSSITVRKAMEYLVKDGFVYRVKGKGTYVAERDAVLPDQKMIYLIFDLAADLDASLGKIVQGIHRYYKNREYQLIIEDRTFYEAFMKGKKKWNQAAGLILYPNPESAGGEEYDLRKLYKAGINFVCIDRQTGNYPVNYVGANNHDAEYSLVQHLISLGHKRIGFLFEKPQISSEKERYLGYCDAMRDYGLGEFITPITKISELDNWQEDLKSGKFSAILCVNDYTASVLLKALRDMGIEVPKDISVAGFDDSDTYRYHQPSLTTVRQNFFSVGYESARILDKLIKGTISGYTKIYIPTELVIRESTGENKNGN